MTKPNGISKVLAAVENGSNAIKYYSWTEIKRHNTDSESKWIVIEGNVYDISNFYLKHPGGSRIIRGYAGDDATNVWTAMHPDKGLVRKYLKPLFIGKVDQNSEDTLKSSMSSSSILEKDFAKLRDYAIAKGYFKANGLFFFLHSLQCILLEFTAFLLLSYFGVTLWSFLLAVICLGSSQALAGWSQHDYGHLSVFNSPKLNRMGQQFVLGHIKGYAPSWWNYRHSLHHSKPNDTNFDPDIDLSLFFVVGDKIPVEWGKEKKGFMPYNWQHKYFFLFGPPTVFPIHFNFESVYYTLSRGNFRELMLKFSFELRFGFLFGQIFDSWLVLFFFIDVCTICRIALVYCCDSDVPHSNGCGHGQT